MIAFFYAHCLVHNYGRCFLTLDSNILEQTATIMSLQETISSRTQMMEAMNQTLQAVLTRVETQGHSMFVGEQGLYDVQSYKSVHVI